MWNAPFWMSEEYEMVKHTLPDACFQIVLRFFGGRHTCRVCYVTKLHTELKMCTFTGGYIFDTLQHLDPFTSTFKSTYIPLRWLHLKPRQTALNGAQLCEHWPRRQEIESFTPSQTLPVHLHKLGTSTFFMAKLIQLLDGHRLCKAIFESYQRFSFRLRSGLWRSHSRTLKCCFSGMFILTAWFCPHLALLWEWSSQHDERC